MKIDNIEVKLSTWDKTRIIFTYKNQSLFYMELFGSYLYEIVNIEGIDSSHELDLTSSNQLKITGVDMI